MTADYTVSCDSSEYRLGFIWACVMIFVYPIGCPAYYFYLLYGVRHEIQLGDKETMLERVDESVEMSEETRARQEKLLSLRFLYESYQPRYWWWEIAETTQRLLLTGILVLIAQGSAIQIVVGALLTLSFLHLYARYEPFTDGFVLSIKIVSYWQILFVFWIALLIKADFPSMSDHILGICLVMVIFANLFVDVWKVCRIAFFSSRQLRGSSLSSRSSPPSRDGNPNESIVSQTEMGRISSRDRVISTDPLASSSSPLHLNPSLSPSHPMSI
jgi:hypothetical protein